jgi:hypothetical protein
MANGRAQFARYGSVFFIAAVHGNGYFVRNRSMFEPRRTSFTSPAGTDCPRLDHPVCKIWLPLLVPLLLLFCPLNGFAAGLDWQPIKGGRVARLKVPTAGKTGFTLLPGVQTGIQFTNTIDDRLIMENNNFMEGSGVALGDYDGDGWCDIYFCALDGTNALYRNRGDWTFEDVTTSAGVGDGRWHSTGAVFADVDGDGDLDLLVNSLGHGTHLFLNLGNGRFREATLEAGFVFPGSQTGSTSLALADIDGDGDLDLYVANYGTLAILRAGGRADMKQVNGKWQLAGPYAERLRFVDGRIEEVGEPDVLYRNDGKGHFKPVPWDSEWFRDADGKPFPAPWDFGLGVQMRDINEDGFPDIYVCNDFQTVDRLWLNDGTGHFRLAPRLAMRKQSFASMGVDFADVDRDGRQDFFVVEMSSREHAQRMRQLGTLQPTFPVPGRFENRPEVARNTLFWNRGDGTYAEIANFSGVACSDWSWQPVFLDVDLDGFEDVLIVNGNAFDVQDRDALNQVRALGRQTPEQTRTNILLYPRLAAPNVAFHNNGDLTFTEVGREWGFDSRQVSHGIALADLDHDGDLDVVVNCLDAPPLIYRNDSTAPRVAVRLRGKAPNIQGIGAKIKLLGGAVSMQSQEIVSGGRYLSGDDPMRVFAAGSSTNRMRLEVTWRNGKRSLLDDVQANCLYEIHEEDTTTVESRESRVAGSASELSSRAARPSTLVSRPLFQDVSSLISHTHHEEQFNDYERQPLLIKQLSQLGPGVAWCDLNGDGHDDLFIGSGRGGRIAAFRGDGRGRFTSVSPTNAPAVPDDLAGFATWAAPDGTPVLLAAISRYENPDRKVPVVELELTKSTGELVGMPVREITIPPGQDSPGPLAVADYDGDGDLDLFVGGRLVPGAYPQPATSRLFRNEDGKFRLDETNQRELEKVGLVSGAVWTDLNGDGFPELVLACEWGPLIIFQNQHGKLIRWNASLMVSSNNPTLPKAGGGEAKVQTLNQLTGWWTSVTAGDLDGDGRLDLIAGNWGLNSGYEATAAEPQRLYYGDIGGRGVVDLIETEYAPELQAVVPRRSLSGLSQAAPRLNELFPTHRAFSTTAVSEIFQRLGVHPAEVQATTLASMVFFNRGDHFKMMPLPVEAQWTPVFGLTIGDFDGDGWEDVFLAQNFFALRPELPRLDAGRGLLLRGTGNGRLEPVPGQISGVTVYGEQRGVAASDFDEDGRLDLVVTQNAGVTRLFQNVNGAPGLRIRLIGPPQNPQGIGAAVHLQFARNDGPLHEIHAGSGYWSQDSLVTVIGSPETPRRIAVRWPGAKTTTTDLPGDSHEVSVSYDGGLKVNR